MSEWFLGLLSLVRMVFRTAVTCQNGFLRMLSLVRMVFKNVVTCQNGFLANMELNIIGRKVRVGILSLK